MTTKRAREVDALRVWIVFVYGYPDAHPRSFVGVYRTADEAHEAASQTIGPTSVEAVDL